MTPDEEAKAKRKRRFFVVRVSILLFILFLVVLYAVRDLRSRRGRNAWDHTLDVAIVLVHAAGEPPIDPDAQRALEDRIPVLEDRLAAEAERHRPGLGKPLRFKLHGPVEVAAPPPSPASDGAVDLASQTIAMKKWLADVDPRAGVVPEHWDTRIYVVARKPASERRSFVEGQSEQDGRIGSVAVELDASMADTTLFVVTHELMHTLGATDKYDAAGNTKLPEGLADPDREPLYPQDRAEVMARNRVVAPGNETIPTSLDQLAVGPQTATEIGWRR
ncbi:MAG: hypothetical protein KIT84_01215 [Labilithrix sp.]|nr:hypothetical protein [Labilithrix sp.]MCW5809605.1 hypothetical protein [Labilithrix sp.]